MLGYPRTLTPPLQHHYDKTVTVIQSAGEQQSFNGFVHRSWNNQRQCFFAGDRQGHPVIQGNYRSYEVNDMFSAVYTFSKFQLEKCLSQEGSSGNLGSGFMN